MPPAPRDPRERLARLALLLERCAVALLLAAGLVPRVRDLAGGFDREIEGAQGAFFALAAVNYERLGVGFLRGYPIVQIDLPAGWERGIADPGAWYTYVHHPPTVPLLAYGALRAMGPPGWDRAWRDDRSPEGVELPMRLPFLVLHVAGLWAFWWALRQAGGTRAALLGLALLAVAPASAHYATLVNYENPALPPLLVGMGLGVRFARDGRRRDLLGVALAFALAGAVTFAPLLFAPALALAPLVGRQPRRAPALVAAAGAGAAAPLALHALLSARALASRGAPSEGLCARARLLLSPLLDGSAPLPEWADLQAGRLAAWFTWPLGATAALGLGVLLARAARRRESGVAALALPLLVGGALVQLAFYRHTLDPQHNFLLWIAPAVAALAAAALDALAPGLLRLRAGVAPLVVIASGLGMLAVQRLNVLRHQHRAPAGAASLSGAPAPEIPLPTESGGELARLLPPRGIGLVPSSLGLNLASPFYAWRTLWPIRDAGDDAGLAVAQRYGLADAPRFLVLPREPPPSARAQVEALRAALTAGRGPDAQTASWRAWRL